MKFYKEAATGLWVLDNLYVPAGQLLIGFNPTTDYINIRHLASPNINIVENRVYSNFEDENGDPYASLAAFKAATNEISQGSQGGGAQFKSISVEITRPDKTTAYAAGDVVADVGAAFLPLLAVAKATGTGVKILRVRIQTDDTGVAGTKFNVHLYREAPTFIADNAAFAVAYANATKRVGAIPVLMGTGTMGTVGMNDYNQVILNPVARDVYYILETVSGFTPSANSTKFTIAIDCELSNQ